MSLWKKISLGVVIVILLLLGSVAFLVGHHQRPASGI